MNTPAIYLALYNFQPRWARARLEIAWRKFVPAKPSSVLAQAVVLAAMAGRP